MISAILGFLTSLPKLVSLVEGLLSKINELIEIQKDNALKQKIILASQKAILTKDSSELEAIFRGQK